MGCCYHFLRGTPNVGERWAMLVGARQAILRSINSGYCTTCFTLPAAASSVVATRYCTALSTRQQPVPTKGERAVSVSRPSATASSEQLPQLTVGRQRAALQPDPPPIRFQPGEPIPHEGEAPPIAWAPTLLQHGYRLFADRQHMPFAHEIKRGARGQTDPGYTVQPRWLWGALLDTESPDSTCRAEGVVGPPRKTGKGRPCSFRSPG